MKRWFLSYLSGHSRLTYWSSNLCGPTNSASFRWLGFSRQCRLNYANRLQKPRSSSNWSGKPNRGLNL